MDSFVQATLEDKQGEYGIYQELHFRFPDGATVFVFYEGQEHDSNIDPVSDHLLVGKAYNMLITVRVRHPTYAPVTPPNATFKLVTKEIASGRNIIRRNDLLQGKVLDPFWDASSQTYQAIASPRVYDQRYVLLETAIGKVVVSRKHLEEDLGAQTEQIAAGGYLEWEPSRLDLLAILSMT